MALISKVFKGGEKLFPQKVQVQVQVHMPKMMQPTPDDKKVMQQILAGHSPDASLLVDENALLTMAQDILSKATPTLPLDPKTDSEILEDDHQQRISEALALTIHKIGCELSCNCSGEGDVKAITLAVFNALVKYSWEDKAQFNSSCDKSPTPAVKLSTSLA
ncbi:hypothetical protein AAC387_Pa02g3768 [Persea americana]